MRAPSSLGATLIGLLLLAAPGCAEKADPGASGEGPTCLLQCSPGERRCDPQGEAQVCADYDGDGCPEWGEPLACGAGAACVDGRCTTACAASCGEGEALCSGGGLRRCVTDSEGCRVLGAVEDCGEGERCDDGACVPTDQVCTDACARTGAGECAGDGYRRCGQFDDDPCLELGPTVDCGDGETCRDGQCVASCTDACSPGDVRCQEGGVQSCGDFDDDSCLEFGPTRSCGDLERCDDGVCVPEARVCTHSCPAENETVCDGDALRQCGNYDDDNCLELSPGVDCGPRSACRSGACQQVCEDACVAATLRCAGEGVEVCQLGPGPCLAWAPYAACADDERCFRGQCVPEEEPCESVCEAGAARCVEEGRQRCVSTFDGCFGWADPEPCPADTRCAEGTCASVERPAVVINEIFYDGLGGDGPQVFVELAGPRGQPLEGWRLVRVNGADGETYGGVPLAGVIPPDGLFVVTRPDAEAELATEADLMHANADLQNGPDSVQLLDGETVVDAVAYGDFERAEFAAGEGNPASDVDEGQSLSRDNNHRDSDDNAADFRAGPPSPGR